VLGTTPESLDVGLPNGDDVHLEMAREPYVSIAEPSTLSAIAVGDRVSVVRASDAANARVRAVVVSGPGVRFVPEGSYGWDAAGGRSMTSGHVVRSVSKRGALWITLSFPGGRREFVVPAQTRVVVLRPGSRGALLNPHAVFVFVSPPTDGLSDVVLSAIVADGTLTLPF
jgi:hypothetical protein